MHKPHVSFVVPCYKLAHLLADCINSILSQSYADFEVLITAEVAGSFKDAPQSTS
jgi:glycosyltransferase involved in cell wall biosynthesis